MFIVDSYPILNLHLLSVITTSVISVITTEHVPWWQGLTVSLPKQMAKTVSFEKKWGVHIIARNVQAVVSFCLDEWIDLAIYAFDLVLFSVCAALYYSACSALNEVLYPGVVLLPLSTKGTCSFRHQ